MAKNALLLIDWQQGFADHQRWGGNRNNPQAEKHGLLLLEHWRRKGHPVFHCVHNSQDPKSLLRMDKPTGQVIAGFESRDNEPLIVKDVNSCFIGTDLEARLRERGVKQLTVCGLTTNHCVSTTVRMAGNLGFDVTVVGDACATFDRLGVDGTVYTAQLVHDLSLANIHNEFCVVKNTLDILKV